MKKQPCVMDRLNSPILALLATTLFIALAVKSCEPKMASNKEMADFVEKQLANYKSPHPMDKRLQVMEIWGLTESDVAKPVNIFASNGRMK